MSKKIRMSELLEQVHDVADDHADTTAFELSPPKKTKYYLDTG